MVEKLCPECGSNNLDDFFWKDNPIDEIRAEKLTCPACTAQGKYAKILESKEHILLYTCHNQNCHVATFFVYLEDEE